MSEFDKIIGYNDIKTELMKICDVIRNTAKYDALGVAPVAGLLLNGHPGVGKTLMANCFIKESGRKAYVLRKDKPDGEFVNEIKNVFTEAMKNAPSIILLDDMDKFANVDNYHQDADEYVTIQSCIDEIKGKGVFVVATTNGTRKMPDSLLRAGRFDFIINIKEPEGQDAIDIVRFYLSKKKVIADINAEEIAHLLCGNSCASLETIINIAGQYAGYKNKTMIDMDDIISACLRVIYDAPESNKPHDPTTLKKTAYHEAGHVVVNEILEPNCVDLVSVRKAYSGDYGITTFHNTNEYWNSFEHMENRVIALLAGKAVTEIVFGDVDLGAVDDLNRAFRIASRFVDDYCAYGFNFSEERGVNVNSFELIQRKENRLAVDIEKYYTKAKKILIDHREFLDALAKRLQEKDTLVGSEIREIKVKVGE